MRNYTMLVHGGSQVSSVQTMTVKANTILSSLHNFILTHWPVTFHAFCIEAPQMNVCNIGQNKLNQVARLFHPNNRVSNMHASLDWFRWSVLNSHINGHCLEAPPSSTSLACFWLDLRDSSLSVKVNAKS